MKINRMTIVAFLAGLLIGAALFWSIFFVLGIKLPPLSKLPEQNLSSPSGTHSEPAQDNNLEFYEHAITIARAIRDGDYHTLANWIDTSGSLYIVPYSTVDFEKNLNFTASQIRAFKEDKTTYLWGIDPNNGKPIEMTPADFFDAYLRIRDYSMPEIVGNNKVVRAGNAVENVAEAFPDSYFIDLYFTSTDSQAADWSSLKLVFNLDASGGHKLVAIIHGANTLQ